MASRPTARPLSFGVFAARGPRDPRQRARGAGRSGFTSPVNKPLNRARTGRITVTQPGRATEEYSVALGQTVIAGRATDADIVIRDPQVSRRHLSVEFNESGWIVRDLGATNPAEVDSGSGYRTRQLPEMLVQGRLRIGTAVLTLHPVEASLAGLGALSSQIRHRPALAAIAVGAMGVIAVLVALTLASRRTDGDLSRFDALTRSVEEHDAPALLAALGNTTPDPDLLRAVSDQFSRRPNLRIEIVSSHVLSEADQERTEERVYRVTEPEAQTRRLTFEVRSRRAPETGTWTEIAMIPLAEATE